MEKTVSVICIVWKLVQKAHFSKYNIQIKLHEYSQQQHHVQPTDAVSKAPTLKNK